MHNYVDVLCLCMTAIEVAAALNCFATATPRNSKFWKGAIWWFGLIAYSVHWLCGSLKRYLNCGEKISRLQVMPQRTQREMRFPCNDRTDEVNKLFIIWPF